MSSYENRLRSLTRESDELVEKREGELLCQACGHGCLIKEGNSGICQLRYNEAGKLHVPWGYVSSLHVDPIEKKPFFHVLPGQGAMSYGMLGCNMKCPYCQNWQISQTLCDEKARVSPQEISPERIVEQALKSDVDIITATYNEPLITSEFNHRVFELARQEGLITGYVSNGYASPQVLEYLRPVTDLFNVDFKVWSLEKYKQLGAAAEIVKDSIKRIYEMGFHLEVITLVVPGQSDDSADIERMAEFLVSVSEDIPWHLTAFRPAYKWRDRSSTTVSDLRSAYKTALNAGMNHVYCGNLPGLVKNSENTYCPDCGELLVERRGYSIHKNHMSADICPRCDREIYGRFS